MNYLKVFLKQFSKAIIIATVKSALVIFGVCAIMFSIWAAAIMLSKYPSGRDTVESFGSGRYQILRSPKDYKGNIELSLYDLEENVNIEENIYNTQ